MTKTLAIIGGGISGLTAGIYALQAGYDTTIYERNSMVGGECTGWNRQGYHIDNCVHFLVGCNEESNAISFRMLTILIIGQSFIMTKLYMKVRK